MLTINTINEFFQLPTNLQYEIQKALKTKDRLEDYLRSLNKKKGDTVAPSHAAHWVECSRCKPHWKKAGQPGWVWIEQSRDDSDIHPSQINKCLKLIWYSCNGYTDQMEEFIEPKLRLIFDLGHAWHDIVQGYGRRGAWCDPKDYHKEVEIDPDAVAHDGTPILPIANQYWIRGHVDAVIDNYVCLNVPGLGDVSIRVVHEYKTINSGQYSKLTRPKPEHKYQATIYAAVFNVPIVVYLYTNKDNCQMADFPLPFDHSIWSEIVQKVERVQHYTNIGQEPPWEETSAVKNPQECIECPYRALCKPPMVQLNKAAGRRYG